MNILTAARTARALMDEYGLSDWRFAWDNAKRRHGQTAFRTRTISLSRPLTRINDEDIVLNTVRHEIAHALVGPKHGHDATWKRMARQVGAQPERCCSEGESVPAPIIGVCPNCTHEHPRFRAPNKGSRHYCNAPSCRHLPIEARVITWKRRAR